MTHDAAPTMAMKMTTMKKAPMPEMCAIVVEFVRCGVVLAMGSPVLADADALRGDSSISRLGFRC